MHIDHIGIAVSDLEAAIKTYESLLDSECYKREVVKDQNVETAFLNTGESKVELLGATDPESVIQKYISKHGEGIHHVAFEVEDIHRELKRLKEKGFKLLNEEPSEGASAGLEELQHPSALTRTWI